MEERKLNKKKVFCTIILFILLIFIISNHTFKKENGIISIQNDDVFPTLEMEERIVHAIGNDFKMNAKAFDNIDGDISDKIEVKGEYNLFEEGIYTVNYFVTDSSGNQAQKEQIIEVRKPLENGLPVLMYHFFYSKDDPNYIGKKPDNNLMQVEKFAQQMDYLKEQNFYFPKWEEVDAYIDGKMKLPEKSILITDDDGNFTFFDLAVPVIEPRGIPVTSFIITSWYEERLNENYLSVNYQSHSDDMHKSGKNGKGVMVNWNYDEIVDDLKKSKNKIENHTGKECIVFCYPFGHYNDVGQKALSDTGFKFAFTVENGRVKPNANKLALPRVRINGDITFEQFKNLVD